MGGGGEVVVEAEEVIAGGGLDGEADFAFFHVLDGGEKLVVERGAVDPVEAAAAGGGGGVVGVDGGGFGEAEAGGDFFADEDGALVGGAAGFGGLIFGEDENLGKAEAVGLLGAIVGAIEEGGVDALGEGVFDDELAGGVFAEPGGEFAAVDAEGFEEIAKGVGVAGEFFVALELLLDALVDFFFGELLVGGPALEVDGEVADELVECFLAELGERDGGEGGVFELPGKDAEVDVALGNKVVGDGGDDLAAGGLGLVLGEEGDGEEEGDEEGEEGYGSRRFGGLGFGGGQAWLAQSRLFEGGDGDLAVG